MSMNSESIGPFQVPGLYTGDCRKLLQELPDDSVQACVTSPPYWALRDYQVDGQIGLEPSPEEYVDELVAVFREVRRALRPDGTLWVNLGDTYITETSGVDTKDPLHRGRARRSRRPNRRTRPGLKHKDMVGAPWLVAFALRADGWYLRADIVWSKTNPMPETVGDRPTRSHEYIFLLTKSSQYYYDAEAITEPVSGTAHPRGRGVHPKSRAPDSGIKANESFGAAVRGLVDRRNKRSVWTVPSAPFKGAHFATFPIALIEPCILAGSRVGDLVLDPFFGSGTTGAAAEKHERRWLGFDINGSYARLAAERTAQQTLPGTSV